MSGSQKKESREFDEWARSIEPSIGCKTCGHPHAPESIRSLLKAMVRNRATHITLRQLHRKIRELHDDYKVGYWGFRNHIYSHERDLYDKARGLI